MRSLRADLVAALTKRRDQPDTRTSDPLATGVARALHNRGVVDTSPMWAIEPSQRDRVMAWVRAELAARETPDPRPPEPEQPQLSTADVVRAELAKLERPVEHTDPAPDIPLNSSALLRRALGGH